MISADLGKKLEDYVEKLVETGRYGSKSEVLREGVRLIQDRETRLAAQEDAIARGRADADAGRTKPAEEVFRRLSKKYSAPDDGPVPGALLKRIRATVSKDTRGGKSLFDSTQPRPLVPSSEPGAVHSTTRIDGDAGMSEQEDRLARIAGVARELRAETEAAAAEMDGAVADGLPIIGYANDVDARLARVREYALSVFENQAEVERWITAPNLPLGGARPIDLLVTELGMKQVLQELGQIEFGGPV